MKIVVSSLVLVMSFFISSLMAIHRLVPAEFTTIQEALNASAAGDSVLVDEGVYYENITWPQVDSICLLGTGSREKTIIDGNHTGIVLKFTSSPDAPVITLATRVSGFTIRNGYGNINGPGISLYFASPTLQNLIIAFNSSLPNGIGTGGGMAIIYSSPYVENTIIAYNKALSGAGAWIDSGSPVFNNCIIADNGGWLHSPYNIDAAQGIWGTGECSFQFNHCTVARNSYFQNPSIILRDCTLNITNSTITDNYKGFQIWPNGLWLHNIINMMDCNISYNECTGLELSSTTALVSIQNNWWGASNGPYNVSLNPSGEGDTIMGNVDFTSWLTSPNCLAPLNPPKGLEIVDIENHAITLSWSEDDNREIDTWKINYGTDSLAVIQDNSHVVTGGTTENILITGLESDTDYYIQVSAQNDTGNESWYSQRIKVRTTNVANSDPIAPVVKMSNYPNPFACTTTIQYELKRSGSTTLQIYNLKGQLVKTLIQGNQCLGMREISWDGRNENNELVGSGMYFAKLECNGKTTQAKLILMK